jgi:CoA:oxalate CoA-transferase
MADGPLSGTIVVDLTRVLAGPFCTLQLRELGARVIKVEPPDGDVSRKTGPFVDGRSAYFGSINRGKESITLDLKAPGDREIFEDLLARADVLTENYRPGVLEKLGYPWDTLHARFPRLIYAAISGFGHTGPYIGRPAYDHIVQAMGGIMSITGQPDAPPTRVGSSIGDLAAGLYAALGVVSALHDRNRTGEGAKVDIAMLDCQVALLENAVARYFATGTTPQPIGARHPSITPFDSFATKDGYIVIGAGHSHNFEALCRTIGAPELLEDERFASNELRNRHEPELKALLEQALSRATSAEWLERLQQVDVPCSPINTIPQIVADPQIAARNMIVGLDDEQTGTMRFAGNPVKLSTHSDPPSRRPAPALDGDRDAILAWLGRDQRRRQA